MKTQKSAKRAQAAIDFLMSYGIALIAIAITLIVIYRIGTNPFNAPDMCTAAPGWACGYLSLSQDGVLNITVAQSSGAALSLTGISCSSQINATGNKPRSGNIYVTSLPMYYPAGAFTAPNVIYSGTEKTYNLYCYSGSSSIAKGNLGQPFTGYVWINYSTPYLANQRAIIITFNTKYS